MALKYKMKQGKGEQEFCQENALVLATPSSNNTREDSTHRYHQMVSTEIRLIISLQPKMEKLYTVNNNNNNNNKDHELTVAQIMNLLLPNSDLNRRK